MLSGQWLIPKRAFRFDPSNPNAAPVTLTEEERREEYLQDIGEGHALMGLVRRCLSNNPAARPGAEEILRTLDERAPQHPPLFTDRVEALQRVGSIIGRAAESQQQVGRLQRDDQERQQLLNEKNQEIGT